MGHSGTYSNHRTASRSDPGRFLPQYKQIAQLLAQSSLWTSLQGSAPSLSPNVAGMKTHVVCGSKRGRMLMIRNMRLLRERGLF